MVNISLKYTQRINSCLYPVIQMKVKPHTQRDIRVIHSWALLTFSLSRWIITSRVWKMTSFNYILSQIRTTKKIHSVLMPHVESLWVVSLLAKFSYSIWRTVTDQRSVDVPFVTSPKKKLYKSFIYSTAPRYWLT